MSAGFLQRHAMLGATAAVCLLLYLAAGLRYDGFFSWRVFSGFFADNAVLGIVAAGMTLVIISGGIDLSVGAVVGFSSILIAALTTHAGWHPLAAACLAAALGTSLGAAMGGLIHRFQMPAFIVTLAGMFLARGAAFIISQESITIEHGFLRQLHALPFDATRAILPQQLAHGFALALPATSVIFLVIVIVGIFIARRTRFGRNIYAVGSHEQAARLMGLPLGRTRIGVYACSGFCAALAGAVHSLYTFSGNPTAGAMLELDAIAAAVIGGTTLAGGVGSITGTLLGVLILAIIQTAITFDGSLSSWWARIASGALLLGFVLLQRLLNVGLRRGRSMPSAAIRAFHI